MEVLFGVLIVAAVVSLIVLLLGATLALIRTRRSRQRGLMDGGGPPVE
jgi:hypothetical protein